MNVDDQHDLMENVVGNILDIVARNFKSSDEVASILKRKSVKVFT